MTVLLIPIWNASDGFLPRTPFVAPDAVQKMYLAWIRLREQISTPIEELSLAEPQWLIQAYRLGAAGQDDEIVFNMMSAINEMLRAGRFGDVDSILLNIRERETPLVVVEGLLRFCSRAKASLRHWNDLKARLLREAARRGDDQIIFSQ
jgi:hypothetical protein